MIENKWNPTSWIFFARKELSCHSFSFLNMLKVNALSSTKLLLFTLQLYRLFTLSRWNVERFSLFCSALMRRLRRPRTYLHFKNYWFLPQLIFAPLFIKDNQNWSLFGLYLKEVIPKRDILSKLFIYIEGTKGMVHDKAHSIWIPDTGNYFVFAH